MVKLFDPFVYQQLTKRRNTVLVFMMVALSACLYEMVGPKWLAWFGLAYASYYVGDLATKLVFNLLPRRMIDGVHDKAVLITGCDSGFGNRLAVKLDSLGFQVYAGCLDGQCQGANDLRLQCSDRLHIVQMDVTSDDQVAAAVRSVSSTLSKRKLWAVVNNAGVACGTEIEWAPIELFQRMFDVNSLGVVRVSKAFLPLLRQGRQGRIVIIASMAGRVTVPGFTPYAMSKFAAVAFADGLRREMKKWNISVHLIEPSIYKTNISMVEPLFRMLKGYWENVADDVRRDYGQAYLEEFKETLAAHMSRAKPECKLDEVVDDVLDATIGVDPLLRYVPAMDVQIRSRSLLNMPMEMQDHVLNEYSPQTIPAALLTKSRSQ